jgi:hypothetical protein
MSAEAVCRPHHGDLLLHLREAALSSWNSSSKGYSNSSKGYSNIYSSSNSSNQPGTGGGDAYFNSSSSSSQSHGEAHTTASTSTSSSSTQLPSIPHTATSSSSSSSRQDSSLQPPGSLPYDMSLPLDDCALLRQHCSNLGPVLVATADWVAGGSSADTGPLRPALKQFMAAEVNAAASSSSSSSSSSSKVVSDGPRRRTILPRFLAIVDLSALQTKIDTNLQILADDVLSNAVRRSLVQLLCSVAKQVARELVVEKGSAGYDALLQAASYAGMSSR